ncbi:hypothetical protein C8R47DRAFT_1229880 [Mycena vitilis]|nr:hypothetical protein C8R47DRAFT_1229880 [Mycena vitilis]
MTKILVLEDALVAQLLEQLPTKLSQSFEPLFLTPPAPVALLLKLSQSLACVDTEDWYTVWWCGMARFLLDGHCALSYTESMRQFQLMEFGNMNPLCRLKMFEAIRDDNGNGHKYGMLDEATKELMQGITVTPMEDDF